MVNWHPLGTIWHPLEGPGRNSFIKTHHCHRFFHPTGKSLRPWIFRTFPQGIGRSATFAVRVSPDVRMSRRFLGDDARFEYTCRFVEMLIFPGNFSGKIETLPTLPLGRSSQFLGDATMISYLQAALWPTDPMYRVEPSGFSIFAFNLNDNGSLLLRLIAKEWCQEKAWNNYHARWFRMSFIVILKARAFAAGCLFQWRRYGPWPQTFDGWWLAMILFLMGKNPVD